MDISWSFVKDMFRFLKFLKEAWRTKYGEPLRVDIRQSKEPYPTFDGIDGKFIPLEITFFNDNPFAISITEISLIDKDNGKIIIGDYNPEGEIIEVEPQQAEKLSHTLKTEAMVIPPSFAGGGILKIGIEGETSIIDPIPVLLTSRDILKSNLNQVDMEFTYLTPLDKTRPLKVKATSQPLK